MSNMLNLKIHGYYKFSCGPYANYAGYVAGKTIHDKMTHTYFMVWPNERDKGSKRPIGIYLWDIGRANKTFEHFHDSIVKCKEMTIEERGKIYHKFAILGQSKHVWWDDPAKYGIKWRIKHDKSNSSKKRSKPTNANSL